MVAELMNNHLFHVYVSTKITISCWVCQTALQHDAEKDIVIRFRECALQGESF